MIAAVWLWCQPCGPARYYTAVAHFEQHQRIKMLTASMAMWGSIWTQGHSLPCRGSSGVVWAHSGITASVLVTLTVRQLHAIILHKTHQVLQPIWPFCGKGSSRLREEAVAHRQHPSTEVVPGEHRSRA